MPFPKCPATSAAKAVARAFFDDERASKGETQFMADCNSKQVYGQEGPGGQDLIKLITKDKAVRREFKRAMGSRSTHRALTDEIEEWLTKWSKWTVVNNYGRRFVKVTANSGSTIPVGGIVAKAQKSADGSALAAVQDGKGIALYFVLPEEGLEAYRAVQKAAKGEGIFPIHNVFGEFDDGKIEEIAFEQTRHNLKLLADESGCSVADILGGYTLEQVHAVSFEELEALAMARGEDRIRGRHIWPWQLCRATNIRTKQVHVGGR